jgi:hypothetical protein
MSLEEGEKLQAKGMHNIFNKTIRRISQISRKKLPIHLQEASRTWIRLDQNRNYPWNINIKTTRTEKRERILKDEKEKN